MRDDRTVTTSRYGFNHIVLQPTSLCNLNCRYCYLADRNVSLKMSHNIADKISNIIAESVKSNYREINVVWHSGEPLSIGIKYFEQLILRFEDLRKGGIVKHSIQTNATLINESWCELFSKYDIHVGVSLDGSGEMNQDRVDWSNRPSLARTLRGIDILKSNEIPFGILSVITSNSIDYPESFFEFIVSTGCESLSINFEEIEGVNLQTTHLSYDKSVDFWARLFSSWHSSPTIVVREFNRVLSWINHKINVKTNIINYSQNIATSKDLWPTIAWNGDFCLISPEFLSVPKSNSHDHFIVGNIAHDDLISIVDQAHKIEYVKEYEAGVGQCASQCGYFDYCGGGQASNKYFELGKLDSTETMYCMNSKKALIDGVIRAIGSMDG